MNGKTEKLVQSQVPPKEYETNNTKHQWDIQALKAKHKVLKEYKYTPTKLERGYTGKILFVNLSTLEIEERPVSDDMKKKFTGGKGFGLKLVWDNAKPSTRAHSEENVLAITTGPICGVTQYPGSGKSLVVSVSPATDIICDCNVGGFFGPYLKFSGFDALAVQGKASEEVVVVIDGQKGVVRIETAPEEEVNTHLLAEQLTYMYAPEDTDESRLCVSVVSSGKGAENSYFGCLNFSFWDIRRKVARIKQAGRGGLGNVFRSKKAKAFVVISPAVKGDSNNPADINKIIEVSTKMHREIRDLDRSQCNMRDIGTAHLVEIMDAYDLLPIENFRFGSHPKALKTSSEEIYKYITPVIPDGCWFGCTMACAKTSDGFEVLTGPYKGQRVTVDGPEYETVGACTNICMFDPKWILEFNFYCDTYGLDTISAGTTMAYLMEMYEYGILNKERCDGLELWFGNNDAVLEFLHRIGKGDQGEFVKVAAKGTRRVKDWLKEKGWGDPMLIEECGMENKGLEYSQYVSKESLAQQGGYALTNKGPQHDEAWLIFMDMVNNHIPTFEDKAEALHYFPVWRTWFGLNGLCKLPWNDVEPSDNAQTDEPAKVPEHVQNYATLQSAVTGNQVGPKDLFAQSERVYNWQRSMNVWMGRGKRKDDRAPYRSIGPVTELEYKSRQKRYDEQMVSKLGYTEEQVKEMPICERLRKMYDFRRNQYEKLTDAVYYRRGWTPNGVPTPKKMIELG
ncbi:MAG: aldehyde ferredoxin oxidoreductase C-terminal domain-containing protein, partial [Candidatus Thermoplasmatota archaeon]|nr:aldehyde ferredoxin oxidoreductase C-terminal domain-containing protein [Candidatus Thermoplasmatota archaeon]